MCFICTRTNGYRTNTIRIQSIWTRRPFLRARCSATKFTTAAPATETLSSATRFSTAIFIRTSPRACGSYGAVMTCSRQARRTAIYPMAK